MQVIVRYTDAILGGTAAVTTIHGQAQLSIPAGTQHGQVLSIPDSAHKSAPPVPLRGSFCDWNGAVLQLVHVPLSTPATSTRPGKRFHQRVHAASCLKLHVIHNDHVEV